MTPFETIRSVAAHLPVANIDTDVIYPARYLLQMERDGLGQYLFRDWRYRADGTPDPDFVLNRHPFASAEVLIAGEGFGCGSSREQAVWALTGHGIRCVLAPSFGEIFYANAFKNGLLPLVLPGELTEELGRLAEEGATFVVDLEKTTVSVDGETMAHIDLPERQRLTLLNGWDETDLILREDGEAIAAFEAEHRLSQPWLFLEKRL
jgi:3-isopropylmalate/(R)-2-methylmalate dehydratase small subunit